MCVLVPAIGLLAGCRGGEFPVAAVRFGVLFESHAGLFGDFQGAANPLCRRLFHRFLAPPCLQLFRAQFRQTAHCGAKRLEQAGTVFTIGHLRNRIVVQHRQFRQYLFR